MNQFTRLVYVSKISSKAKLDLSATVQTVLRTSRRNNARASISGMLLTFDGHFLQVLEGRDDQVKETLARVGRDDRHDDIKVLGTDFCAVRAFGRWAMCANDLSKADDDILDVLDRRGGFLPYQMSGVAALKLLTTIAAIHSRQTQEVA